MGHVLFLNRLYNSNHYIANLAMDMAINPTIKNLPKSCVLPKQFNLKDYQSCEFYYNELMKEYEKQMQALKDLIKKLKIQINDHFGNGMGSGEDGEGMDGQGNPITGSGSLGDIPEWVMENVINEALECLS